MLSPGHRLNRQDSDAGTLLQINEAQILLKWQPKSASNNDIPAQFDRNSKLVRILNLRFHEEYCSIHIGNGDAVGVLEPRAFRGLSGLWEGPYPIKYEAVIPESEWEANVTTLASHQGRKRQIISVDIDVLGPPCRASDVAKGLGRAGLFLQRPSRRILPPYENPQCLEVQLVPDLETDNDANREFGFEIVAPSYYSHREPEEDNSAVDLDNIMSGACRREYSSNVRVDHRITTSLLPYV